MLPNLITHLSPIAELYLTLLRVHPSAPPYNYAKRGFFGLPVIEVNQHGPKCKQGESWLYFAIPSTASLTALKPDDRLYVGAQTQDRMFRGDKLDGNNYHHADMRSGNGSDNAVAFLNSGQQIAIYRLHAHHIKFLVDNTAELELLRILANQSRTSRKHLGWWYEQYVLHSEPKQWRWNTQGADKTLAKLFRS